MTIHGLGILAPGGAPTPFSYEPGPLQPGEVSIRVTHCGVCHSDVHLRHNQWGITSYPFIPGHEVIGEVAALESAVTSLRKGQRVGVGWIVGACKQCESCKAGDNHLCAQPRWMNVGRHGGFADSVQVDADYVVPIPEGLSSADAAPLLCAGLTTFSPLVEHGVKAGMKVGVVGIGGLGHLAVQIARALGCEVTAFTSSADKEAEAKSLGAAKVVNTAEAGALAKQAGTLDFILDCSSADLDWNGFVGALRPRGKLCVIGLPGTEVTVGGIGLILGQRSVVGSTVGSVGTLRRMLDFAVQHGVRARIEKFPMAQAGEALNRLEKNQVRYRAVLEQTPATAP